MTTFIVLSAADAGKLRGVTTPGNALDPVPLADGVSFILPVSVLSDPAHEAALASFGADLSVQREVDAAEFAA